VDIDQFIARNQADWERLQALSSRARRKVSELRPDELAELIRLYQRASAHLSHARVTYRDPGLTARLTALVAAANGVIYGKRPRTTRALVLFFSDTFPAAFWACRRAILASAVVMFVPALLIGTWLANSDRALDVAISEDQQAALLESQFEDYYSSAPAAEFSTKVLVNNIQVSFLAFAAGVVLGIGFAYDLWAKGTAFSWLPFALGIPILPVYGWLGAAGSLPDLFAVLVPVAAVAGAALAIANALIDLERDREAGVSSIALALGRGPAALLVVVLHGVVASIALLTLEAFEVPSGWATVTVATAALPLAGAALGAIGAFRGGPEVRERAWELQALGCGVFATAWIAAVTSVRSV